MSNQQEQSRKDLEQDLQTQPIKTIGALLTERFLIRCKQRAEELDLSETDIQKIDQILKDKTK